MDKLPIILGVDAVAVFSTVKNEIRKAQACIQQHGVLYMGEKLNGGTQHPLLGCGASRLLPVSFTGCTDAEGGAAKALLEPVWTGEQSLTPVFRQLETETDQPEHIANGFCYTVTLSADYEVNTIKWQEQRLVVHSLKQAASQEKALDARLENAENAIANLNMRRHGRKSLDENEMTTKMNSILVLRILALLGFPSTHYKALGGQSRELAV